MAAPAFCLEFSKAQYREEEAEQSLVVWLSSENRIWSLRRPRQLEFVDKIAREESFRRFLQSQKMCKGSPAVIECWCAHVGGTICGAHTGLGIAPIFTIQSGNNF